MKKRSLKKLAVKKVNIYRLNMNKGGIPKATTQGRSEACSAPRASDCCTYELMCTSPKPRN